MGLLCSRIGCSSKAAASLQFNAAQSTAILVDLTPRFGGMPLCDVHANSRTAPVGWNIVDRRTGAENLKVWASEEEAPATTAPPAQRPPSRRPAEVNAKVAPAARTEPGRTAAPQGPGPVVEPASTPQQPAAAEAADKAESQPNADFPWHKKYSDEEDEDLMADSPLLSRAFRAAKQ